MVWNLRAIFTQKLILLKFAYKLISLNVTFKEEVWPCSVCGFFISLVIRLADSVLNSNNSAFVNLRTFVIYDYSLGNAKNIFYFLVGMDNWTLSNNGNLDNWPKSRYTGRQTKCYSLIAKLSYNIFSCVVRRLPFYIGRCSSYFDFHKKFRNSSAGSSWNNKRQFKKHEKREFLTLARIALAYTILLWIAWIFGILAIWGLRNFIQCLFCVFNSLKTGIWCFIFLFYTMRNPETRKHWKRALQLQQCQKYPTMSIIKSSPLSSSGKNCLQQPGTLLKRSFPKKL